MRHSLAHIGLALICETCDGEVDLPDDLEGGSSVCRQCGIVFWIDAPYASSQSSRSA